MEAAKTEQLPVVAFLLTRCRFWSLQHSWLSDVQAGSGAEQEGLVGKNHLAQSSACRPGGGGEDPDVGLQPGGGGGH